MTSIALPPDVELMQCGNGKAAISAGNHSSQRSASTATPIDDGSKAVNDADLPANTRYSMMSDGGEAYKAEVKGERLNFYVFPDPPSIDADREVAFDVNGSAMRGQNISREASVALALKAREIMRFDAKRRPDGFVYVVAANTLDGGGNSRASVYKSAGFSTAQNAGDLQYAIVQNGKLKPYEPIM